MDRRKFYLELGQRLEAEGTVRIATGIRGERTGRKRFLTAAEEPDRDEFAEKLAGRQRVVVCGGGHVSLALEQVLKTLPLHLTVIDDRPEFASKERFRLADRVLCQDYRRALREHDFGEEAYFVIVTRGHASDDDCLSEILRLPRAYVGMIGSRSKVAAAFEKLRREGWGDEVQKGIHAPIGLPIGGRTPGEIAVSIAAELIQVRNQKGLAVFDPEVIGALTEEADPCVMVTVMEKTGSSPGKKSSRMLVLPDGSTRGTIGGGSVEYTAAKEAEKYLGQDVCQVRDYDLTDAPDTGLGMVCGGKIRVLFETLEPAAV